MRQSAAQPGSLSEMTSQLAAGDAMAVDDSR